MNSNLVEFLRFGSSIPGGYWGCCAGDIIQAFKTLPDEPSSCQSVNGDGGYPQKNEKSEDLFFGMTNRELFLSRLRVGTFGTGDMANHFFLLVLEDQQLKSAIGQAWLPILKEAGFEFIRTVDNSVWSKRNHMFGLFRNFASSVVKDMFTPPKSWTDLPSNGKKELWELIEDPTVLTAEYGAIDKAIWDKIGPAKLYTRAEVEAAGAPVILAGLRSENPQELASDREARQAASNKKQEASLRATVAVPASPIA